MKQKPVVIFTMIVLAVVTTIMIGKGLLKKEQPEAPIASTIEERAQEAQQATGQPMEAQPNPAAPSVPQ